MLISNKSNEKDLELVSKLNWDYNFSEQEMLNLIKDVGNNSNLRLCFFIKSLETFTWQELIYLWGLEECNNLYTDRIRKGLYPKALKEIYDGIFGLLRNKTISYTERSPEELEKLRASFLFNRRNGSKQRIL